MPVPYCEQPEYLMGIVQSIVGVSFALMLFLLALFWMASQFFRKAEYESFVSVELYQLAVSVIMVGTIFGAAQLSCVLSNDFAGGDMFELGTRHLNFVATDLGLNAVLAFEFVKMTAQYWGSMTFRWGLTVWGVAMQGFPSFIVIERLVDFLLMLITPFSASLMVQQIILETIKGVAIPFMLPVGAVLRVFPPTRDAGTFLMASALGFGIVYPFTYVMHARIVPKMLATEQGKATLVDIVHDRGEPELSVFSLFESGLFDPKALLFEPLRWMSYLMLQALFLPALSMIITISFIKSTSKFLGQKFG